MTDPNAPGDAPRKAPEPASDASADEDPGPAPPPSTTDENEPGKGAGRNTDVQRPAEDQTKQPPAHKDRPGAR